MTDSPPPADVNPYQPPAVDAEVAGASADVASVPMRPRVWPVFVAFLLCIGLDLLIVVAVLIVLAVIHHSGSESPEFDLTELFDAIIESESTNWLVMGSTSLVLAAVSLTGAALSPVPFLQRLNLRRPQVSLSGLLVAIFGTLSVSWVFTAIDGLGLLPKSATLEEISAIVVESSPIGFLFSVLLIGIAPGFDEELMFRGYMQTRLVERWGASVGILVTSILFGVLHMDLVQGTFAAVMGLFLGYLTLQTRSIVPSMVCHAVNNTLSTVTTYIGADEMSVVEVLGDVDTETPAFNLVLLGLSTSVLALSFWYFYRCGKQNNLLAQPVAAANVADANEIVEQPKSTDDATG